jgi:hypothetical protein
MCEGKQFVAQWLTRALRTRCVCYADLRVATEAKCGQCKQLPYRDSFQLQMRWVAECVFTCWTCASGAKRGSGF